MEMEKVSSLGQRSKPARTCSSPSSVGKDQKISKRRGSLCPHLILLLEDDFSRDLFF